MPPALIYLPPFYLNNSGTGLLLMCYLKIASLLTYSQIDHHTIPDFTIPFVTQNYFRLDAFINLAEDLTFVSTTI